MVDKRVSVGQAQRLTLVELASNAEVTGWDEPGGATLARNDALRDVQCEVCHGPGSTHVASEGDDGTILGGPDPALCARQCHTPEHSDTFAYDAYLLGQKLASGESIGEKENGLEFLNNLPGFK